MAQLHQTLVVGPMWTFYRLTAHHIWDASGVWHSAASWLGISSQTIFWSVTIDETLVCRTDVSQTRNPSRTRSRNLMLSNPVSTIVQLILSVTYWLILAFSLIFVALYLCGFFFNMLLIFMYFTMAFRHSFCGLIPRGAFIIIAVR